jgi:hypothetical protein
MGEAKPTGGAIERATRHFSALPVVRIEVPEWADDEGRPLVVMAQRFNLRQQDRLEKMKNRYKGFELMAHVLIRWAKDEQGAPLFTLEDKHALMESVDPEVLAGVAYRITNPVDPEELKKNS